MIRSIVLFSLITFTMLFIAAVIGMRPHVIGAERCPYCNETHIDIIRR